MTSTNVVAAARLVRILAVTFAMSLMVGFVAVQAFAHQYHVPRDMLVMQSGAGNPGLTRAIATQESAGRQCREQPTLTDTILFQRVGKTTVQVLSFDEAIAASTARQGWIRSYCV